MTKEALKRGPSMSRFTADGSALIVHTCIRIKNLIDIDTMNETFKINLMVEQEWIAPSTESEETLAEGLDRMDVDWEPEWHPSFEFKGTGHDKLNAVEEFYSIQLDDGTFAVHQITDMTLEIVERMDLEEFPLDIQDLTINYMLNHPSREVRLAPFPGENSKLVDMDGADLSLSEYEPWNKVPWMWREEVSQMSRSGQDCASIKITINMERHIGHYFNQIISIICPLASGVLGAWSIETARDDPEGSRISFDLSVILACVAFKFVLGGMLPAVSYTTLVERYIMMCFIFVFAAFFFHILQGLPGCGLEGLSDDMAKRVDEVSLIVFVAVWVVANILMLMYVIRARKLREQEIKDEVPNYNCGSKGSTSGRKELVKQAKKGGTSAAGVNPSVNPSAPPESPPNSVVSEGKL